MVQFKQTTLFGMPNLLGVMRRSANASAVHPNFAPYEIDPLQDPVQIDANFASHTALAATPLGTLHAQHSQLAHSRVIQSVNA